jgi:hypothetical protein
LIIFSEGEELKTYAEMEIDLYYLGDVEEFFEGVIENSGAKY